MSHVPALARPRSEQLLARARGVYAGLTSSMMKRPEQFALGEAPVYAESGEGALLRDVDGNTFIDLVCGLGANSLGYRHPEVEAALAAQLKCGVLHSLPLELELKAAETVLDSLPGAERVRFFKTGADATSAAVRVARAHTGREHLAVVGYNGWHDHFMFDTPGVPNAVSSLTQRFNLMLTAQEEALLERVASGKHVPLAAVVLAPPYNRVLSQGFLRHLRNACDAAGTLLVFDEIVTGYRLALGGLAQVSGVQPDLTCVSKALAAGMPLSALVGGERLMGVVEKLQVSTTFGGESLSLAACVAAYGVYQNSDYFEHIARLGRRLREGVNAQSAALHSPLQVVGYDPVPMFKFADTLPEHAALAERFVGLMARRGVFMRRDVNFLCAAHTVEQIDTVIGAAGESLEAMLGAGVFHTAPHSP